MANFKFISRAHGELLNQNSSYNIAFDVSSYAPSPFSQLSPFSFSKDFNIPVPGMEDTYAHSKLIDGVTDLSLLTRKPVKRTGNVEGHQFGDQTINIQEARWEIYLPAYFHYLDHFVSKEAFETMIDEQRSGKKVYLYDVCNNGDIRVDEPLAHASLLATYLNLDLLNNSPVPKTHPERTIFAILEDSSVTLEEKMANLIPLLDDPGMLMVFQYRCVEHPQNIDEYYLGLAIK